MLKTSLSPRVQKCKNHSQVWRPSEGAPRSSRNPQFSPQLGRSFAPEPPAALRRFLGGATARPPDSPPHYHQHHQSGRVPKPASRPLCAVGCARRPEVRPYLDQGAGHTAPALHFAARLALAYLSPPLKAFTASPRSPRPAHAPCG